MRSYVVRLHESTAANPGQLRGVVQVVDTGRRLSFTTGEDLLHLLNDLVSQPAPLVAPSVAAPDPG